MVRQIIVTFSAICLTAFSANAREWYIGGTLHDTSMKEWRSATDENRLATSADWAAAILRGAGKAHTSPDEFRRLSTELERCVSQIGNSKTRLKTAGAAATCATQMQW